MFIYISYVYHHSLSMNYMATGVAVEEVVDNVNPESPKPSSFS